MKLVRAELRGSLHGPGRDLPLARIEAARIGLDRRARACGIGRAGRRPFQDVGAPFVAPEIVVDLARLRAVAGPHLVDRDADLATPFDSQRFRLAIGEPALEGGAFHHEGLLEAFGGGDGKGGAVGDFGIGPGRGAAKPVDIGIAPGHSIGRDEPGDHRRGIGIGSARRGNPLVARLLERDIDPVKDGVAIFRRNDLRQVGRIAIVGRRAAPRQNRGCYTSAATHKQLPPR